MTESIDQLAGSLIEARTANVAIDAVPDELIPPSAADAERVDDLVAERTGWPVLGWKIGCTSAMAQQMLGSDGPFAGRVYRIESTGATIAQSDLMIEPLLEGEFAFRFGKRIEASDPPADRAAVIGAIDAVLPAIEFVGGRYSTFAGTPLNLIIADAGSNSLLVLGEPNTTIDPTQLAPVEALMEVDGAETGRGTGEHVLGDPLDALMWLVENLAGRGIAIEVGQVVTTGTATQVTPLAAGSTAVASFEGVGSVSLTRG